MDAAHTVRHSSAHARADQAGEERGQQRTGVDLDWALLLTHSVGGARRVTVIFERPLKRLEPR
jgi:hypothetical protein